MNASMTCHLRYAHTTSCKCNERKYYLDKGMASLQRDTKWQVQDMELQKSQKARNWGPWYSCIYFPLSTHKLVFINQKRQGSKHNQISDGKQCKKKHKSTHHTVLLVQLKSCQSIRQSWKWKKEKQKKISCHGKCIQHWIKTKAETTCSLAPAWQSHASFLCHGAKVPNSRALWLDHFPDCTKTQNNKFILLEISAISA